MNGSSSRAARLVLAIFMSHSATRYLDIYTCLLVFFVCILGIYRL